MIIGALFALVSFPLTVIGAIAGRNLATDFAAPCRTTKVAREIPKDIPWYRKPAAQMFMAGFLPFSAIYIELHYIFASVWGHKIYTLFGILFIAFIMLFIVTSFITVALVYFQLAREDHRWWWRSFFSGGSTGLFIYAYSFFYFFQRSSMDGMLQGSFYFGYMAIISYAFFIMLGFVASTRRSFSSSTFTAWSSATKSAPPHASPPPLLRAVAVPTRGNGQRGRASLRGALLGTTERLLLS